MTVPDAVVEILGRWREDAEHGRWLPVDELVALHPEHADALREHFAAQAMVQQFFAGQSLQSPKAPERIGDYRIVKEIGRGGMGVVYEAEQVSMERTVALKFLHPTVTTTVSTRKRFEREARVTGRLNHTNIVTVYAMGAQGDLLYFAMERVRGWPLDEVIATLTAVEGGEPGRASLEGALAALRGPASHERIAELFSGVADALEVAHAQGVVHRDVKPSNLILDEEGVLKLTDFGLAQLVGDTFGVTRTGEVIGTPLYMSPEQIRSQHDAVDHRTDIYSLGATLYEALSLRRPHEGDDIAALCTSIVQNEPRSLRAPELRIPRDLVTVVEKAMSKEREDRYASAGDMAHDLRAFSEGHPIQARPLGPLGLAWRKVKRHRVRSALVLLCVLFLAAAAIIALDRERAEDARLVERERRLELEYRDRLVQADRALLDSLTGLVFPGDSVRGIGPLSSTRPGGLDGTRNGPVALFTQATELCPDRPEAWIGRALAPGRDIEQRLEDVEKARQRGLDERTAALARAHILRGEHRFEAAQAAEEEASKMPRAAEGGRASYLECVLAFMGGRFDEAGEAADEFLAHVPATQPDALFVRRLRASLKGHRGEDPERDLITLQELGDESDAVAVLLMQIWQRKGREAEVETLVTSLLKRAEAKGLAGHLALAQACGSCGEYALLRRVAEAGLERFPDSYALAVRRIEALLRLRREEDGLKAAEGLIESYPKRHEGRALAAQALVWMKQFERGGAIAKDALKIAPWSALAIDARGRALLGLGRPQEALPCFEHLRDLSPLDVNAYRSIARTLVALGQRDEALVQLARALTLSPTVALLHFERARVLWDLGQQVKAIDGYRHGLVLDAKNVLGWGNLAGVLLDVGRFADALEAASQAVALDVESQSSVAHGNFGIALWLAERTSEAEKELRRAMELDPKAFEWSFSLGQVQAGQGRLDDAIATFVQAKEAGRTKLDRAQAETERGRALANLGRLPEAVEACDEALRQLPDDFRALWLRCQLRLATGSVEGGLADAEAALKQAPKDVQMLAMRASALMRMDRVADAISAAGDALKHDSQDPQVQHLHALGLVYRGEASKEELERAVGWMEAAIRVKSEKPFLGFALAGLEHLAGRAGDARTRLTTLSEAATAEVAGPIHALLALVCLDLDDEDAARSYAEKARTWTPPEEGQFLHYAMAALRARWPASLR